MEHSYFDFATLPPAARYGLMANAVTPRPVAFVTSLSPERVPNAAPFSFFGLLSHDPATLAIGIEPRPDGRRKDTARNIVETGDFIVHIADRALCAQMDACGAPVEPEEDELALNAIATVPGTIVDVPRIADAPVALECRLHSLLPLGPARDIVIGSVVGCHIRADAMGPELKVDQAMIDTIGRVGAASYCSTRDRFRP
ncbi:flavin reductase family protein [Pseudooceanicola sp. C21-150M6]|uniref:flavin reductase family protein n=1 Tax=Pseudooceanicola sp. C21-150M6 TaxID=3434355 RepID=UPI003D7F6C77